MGSSLIVFMKSLIKLYSHIYSLRVSLKLRLIRDKIHTVWITQFLGSVGDNCLFQGPLILEGDGIDCIHIGCSTTIQGHTVLGCRKHYGSQSFDPEISIGSRCDIGAYCHITAVNSIKIGNGLLTGRFVYIGDN